MRGRSIMAAVVLAALLFGCNKSKGFPDYPDPGKERGPIEVLALGQTPWELKAILGEPTTVKATTTIRTTTTWRYDDEGFGVVFVDDKLISGAQWKGSISLGIAIGDSRQRVEELGILIHRATMDRDVGVIEKGDAIIEIQIEGGVVTRFVFSPKDGV